MMDYSNQAIHNWYTCGIESNGAKTIIGSVNTLTILTLKLCSPNNHTQEKTVIVNPYTLPVKVNLMDGTSFFVMPKKSGRARLTVLDEKLHVNSYCVISFDSRDSVLFPSLEDAYRTLSERDVEMKSIIFDLNFDISDDPDYLHMRTLSDDVAEHVEFRDNRLYFVYPNALPSGVKSNCLGSAAKIVGNKLYYSGNTILLDSYISRMRESLDDKNGIAAKRKLDADVKRILSIVSRKNVDPVLIDEIICAIDNYEVYGEED